MDSSREAFRRWWELSSPDYETAAWLTWQAAYQAGREQALVEAVEHLRETEFFHDGLSADLHTMKDKAQAYRVGWDDAAAAIESLRTGEK